MTLSGDERKDILNKLAEGKITANEAAELLSGSESKPGLGEDPFPQGGVSSLKITKEDLLEKEETSDVQPSWMHVRVSDLRSGKNRVTVNIPLRLIGLGLNLGSRFVPEMEGVDWQEIKEIISHEKGILVDVMDEEDGEHVLIYVD